MLYYKKMIEAHRKNSTFRVTARAGVAKRKGLGAEELGGRDRGSGNSEKIRFAVDRLGRSAISTVRFWSSRIAVYTAVFY